MSTMRTIYGDGPMGPVTGTCLTLPAGHNLGDVRFNETGTKKYRLFYNAGGASIPTGSVFQRSFGGTGLYSVTVTTTTETGATAAAGLNEGATIATASYFWGTVWGHPCKMVSATMSIATDAGVCMEGTGQAGYVMISTTPSWNCIGMNMGDAACAATGNATAATLHHGGRFFVAFEDRPAWFTNKIGK
jgi:hypothetical protein